MRSVSIIEPEGIVNACTASWRITRARRIAMMIASAYSRNSDFRRAFTAGAATGTGASGRVWISFMASALEHRQEGLLRHLDLADLFHSLLSFLLFLEQLALARDVAPVALGGHILAHRLDGLAGDDAAADRGLDGDLVELAGDDAAELLGERLALLVRLVPMDDHAQRVDGITVEQDVELHHVRRAELEEVVVEGRVALGDRLQPVVEVDHDLAQGEIELDVHALAHVLERPVLASLVLGELVDLTHELGGHEHGSPDVRLLDVLDLVGGRQLRGILNLEHLA